MIVSSRVFASLVICIAGISFQFFPQQAKQIAVLCYHHIKDDTAGHSPDYTISTQLFTAHLQMLKDSGYHPIIADQLYNYLAFDSSLPSNPVLITFDDGHEEHYTRAAPALEKFGFRGVFFIPTGILNDKGFVSDAQVKKLSDNGHVIGAHTVHHPDLTKLSADDMLAEIDSCRNHLERITGKRVVYFAYPYGAWNNLAIINLKKAAIIAAFQIGGSSGKTDRIYTIKRIMVSGSWTPAHLHDAIKRFTGH